MFFTASKIFEFFVAPVHLFIFLASIGAALAYTPYFRWGHALTAVSAVALLLMAFSPLGHFLAVPLETRFPAPPVDMTPPDGIIVLGGTVDEQLSAQIGRPVLVDAAERLTAPIALKRRFPNARLVFAGGSASLRGSPYTEAESVKRFWRETGIDDANVIYEDRSRNTFENAVYTRDLVRPKAGERWLLVTSAIHMPRSIGIFRQAGFPVIPYPVDFRTNGELARWGVPRFATKAMRLVDLATHEWAGLVAYRLSGKTDALFPAP
jgi:uncharacterized SAM-binding protein YcdF (DUF218 family)